MINFSRRQGSIHYQCHQHCLSHQFLMEIKASLPLLDIPLLPLPLFPRFSSNLLDPWSPLLPVVASPLCDCHLPPWPPHCAEGGLRILLTRSRTVTGKAEACGDAETSSGHVADHSTCRAGSPSRHLMPSTMLFPLHHTTSSLGLFTTLTKKWTETLSI